MSAVSEMRARLARQGGHGDVGRLINSYIFTHHPDAISYQVDYREELHARAPPLGATGELIRGGVNLFPLSWLFALAPCEDIYISAPTYICS
jgi:hypothetical protein